MTPRSIPTTMPSYSLPLAAAALLALAACGGGDDDPARAARRTAAHRESCVAEELAIQANAKISSLDTLRTRAPESLVTQIYPFARAYFDYAKVREQQAAWADSAAAARAPEDSARFAAQAARFTPAAGRPGTMEGNAFASYERDFAAALANPDHPCNREAVDGDEK